MMNPVLNPVIFIELHLHNIKPNSVTSQQFVVDGFQAIVSDDRVNIGDFSKFHQCFFAELAAFSDYDTLVGDFGRQLFKIGPEFQQTLRNALKQDVVDDFFVIPNPWVQFIRQSKNIMKIGYGQKFGIACLQPSRFIRRLALGAMPVAAKIIGRMLVTAKVNVRQVRLSGNSQRRALPSSVILAENDSSGNRCHAF